MSDEEGDGEAVVVGQLPTSMVRRHIKKRALRNKALSISFDEKNLRDFVTGFHKRKKKRRKEAQRQQQEKERLKRLEARKKRKLEKETALLGVKSESATKPSEAVSDTDAAVSEMKIYETGDTTIRVITSALSCEDDEDVKPTLLSSKFVDVEKKPTAPSIKKKRLEISTKRKFGKKHSSKRSRR